MAIYYVRKEFLLEARHAGGMIVFVISVIVPIGKFEGESL